MPKFAVIPDKHYFTIGEVSELCLAKPHVLRYWEQEFKQLKPIKRRGNRRYYRYKDVILVRRIRELLYDKGFTIGGAKLQLSGGKADKTQTGEAEKFKDFLRETISELDEVVTLLKSSDTNA